MRVLGDHYGDDCPFTQIMLSKTQCRQLLDAAESAAPYEAVGLFVGGQHAQPETWRVVEFDNDLPPAEATKGCEVGLEQLTPFARETYDKGLVFTAWWHSHPTTAAKPSNVDRESAMPLQVIVTAADVRPSQKIRAWWVHAGHAFELRVVQA